MLAQYIFLWLTTFLAAAIPPFSSVGYSLSGVLLLQNADPRAILIITVVAATMANMIIRIVQAHLIEKWSDYENLESKNRFQQIITRINNYLRRQEKITKFSSKREKYIETKS